jgi:AbrB family looped-hinge helix DNA binding protein
MPVISISKKGQVLIPRKIREKFGVKPGANVQLLEGSSGIIIKPAPENPIAAACGFLEGDFSLTQDLIQEQHKESEHERKPRNR